MYFFIPFTLSVSKGLDSQGYDFSNSHVWLWELNHKEGWAQKNWCFRTVIWRRLLRVPWTARRSNQSIIKKINSEYSLEGLKLKLKLQYFGHLMRRANSLKNIWLIGKDPDAGKDWRQKEKVTAEDEMVRWRHQLYGHEFEQILGYSGGQRSLACCSPWGSKESNTT